MQKHISGEVLKGALPALERAAMRGSGRSELLRGLQEYVETPPEKRELVVVHPLKLTEFLSAATAHVANKHELECVETILHAVCAG